MLLPWCGEHTGTTSCPWEGYFVVQVWEYNPGFASHHQGFEELFSSMKNI